MDLRAGLSSAGKASTSEKETVWRSSELSVPAQAGFVCGLAAKCSALQVGPHLCLSAAKTFLRYAYLCVCTWLGGGGSLFLFTSETPYCEGKTLPKVGTGRIQVLLCCEGHKLSVNPVQKLWEVTCPTGPDSLLQLVLQKSVNQPAQLI